MDEVPEVIRQNYQTTSYEKATAKKAPGKHWVTLTKADDEKAMVILFLLERAWTLSPLKPEQKLRAIQLQKKLKPKEEKTEIDTGQTLTCPVCGDKFRLRHVTNERTVVHKLKKS